MPFLKKRKKKSQPISKNPAVFEKAFAERVGRDPVTYILDKLENSTDLNSLHYIFDIISAEIEMRNHCKALSFDHYYNIALTKRPPIVHAPTPTPTYASTPTQIPTRTPTQTSTQMPAPTSAKPTKVTRSFAVSQLIGKERFLTQYESQLKSLSSSQPFLKFIQTLHMELDGKELSDTRSANKYIADYFYRNKANLKFPEVSSIVKEVSRYGKQASAHISIYYAMFCFNTIPFR